MSILIKGIMMPTYDYIDIRIFPHGKAEINKIRTATRADGSPAFYNTFDVVELPPSANVEERKTGKWVLKTFDDGYGEYQLYECDKCGAVRAHRTNYCHNCGARMVDK